MRQLERTFWARPMAAFSIRGFLGTECMVLDTTEILRCASLLENARGGPSENESQVQQQYDEAMGVFTESALPILQASGYKSWPTVQTRERVTITAMDGALTNLVFCCRHDGPNAESEKILLRVFGAGTDMFFKRSEEEALFKGLTKRGVTKAKLLCTFQNGRCENFLEGYATFTPNTIRDSGIQADVARLMKQLHGVDLGEDCPFGRGPDFLWNALSSWYESIERHAADTRFELFNLAELGKELQWLVEKVKDETKGCPVVLGHNDLQYGNLMQNTREPHDVCFIDYEYSGYVPLAFELANFFAEFSADYDADVVCDYVNRGVSEAERLSFYEQYLMARPNQAEDVSEKTLKTLDAQVSAYMLVNHMFWGLWGLLQTVTSTIEFNFAQYSTLRFERYLFDKDRLGWTSPASSWTVGSVVTPKKDTDGTPKVGIDAFSYNPDAKVFTVNGRPQTD